MEAELIQELLKYGGLVGVLGYGLYIMWKRYDKYTERTQAELTALRDEVKKYMTDDRMRLEDDRHKMIEVLKNNTIAYQQMAHAMTKNEKVFTCFIAEMKDFKQYEPYKHFKESQKESHQ